MNENASIFPPGGTRRSWRQSSGVPILLGLFCFLIFNANLRQIGSGDTMTARYLPLILWNQGTLTLDANARLVAHGYSMVPEWNRPANAAGKVAYFEPWAYWILRTQEDRLVSLYPIVTPLLVAPLYLPAVAYLDRHGWEQPHVDRVAEIMEKISASVLASAAAVLMFLLLRRECGRWSLPLALAFALGTNTWMISSQALWQHGTGELLFALAMLLAVSTASPMRMASLGAVLVLIAANRPPNGIIAGAIFLWAVWSYPRLVLWLVAGAALPIAALLCYNLTVIGNLFGGYNVILASNKEFFQLNWSGTAGLLLSPAHGLLVYSPFLLFVPVGLMNRLRTPGERGLALLLSLAVAAQIFVYSMTDWRGGMSWGPRYLTDVLPILVWMLAPAPLILRPPARVGLVVAIALSILVQIIGAFWYTRTSNDLIYAGDPKSKQGAWKPGNAQFIAELRHRHARGELQRGVEATIDRIGPTMIPGPEEIPRLDSGMLLEGQVRAGRRAPAQLIFLIDGIVIASVHEYLPQSDTQEVDRATPSFGWKVSTNTHGVSPGEHVLQIAARVEPRSDIRIVLEQRVSVMAP